ncbi:MAG: ABC transporter ATP-binding protein [Corynebacterium sp.]|uniref:ABC transporter ATP-binding protein n=1 Tax=Corynebacterium sp. TaxID=1720 RepID=UPI0026DD4E2B|nr:ABC transporter ATP-binding protein [Corynebacterium sp.]MDO4761328.1 ABC transporter ATP-binding protein [Corynebacterium sp.]
MGMDGAGQDEPRVHAGGNTARIQVRGLSFRHASRKKHALKNLHFTVEAGERVLVLGASGSGKSTLLAALAGVLGADEGERTGEIVTTGVVGMVMQDPDSQVIAGTVGDDVAFGCENLCIPREEIWPKVRAALDAVGLDCPLDHPTAELSGGQKQRLALAGVIAMGADIIVLDEPTANLDPQGVREVVAALTQVAQRTGATVIVVEHRVETWAKLATRALVLADGVIAADGPVAEVTATHGAMLADQGVWMPGHDPTFPPVEKISATTDSAVSTHDLEIGWTTAQPVPPITIPLGASTVITGANGAGKTTLMLTLAGLKKPLAGHIEYHPDITQGLGQDLHEWKSAQLAQRIGYVFQDPEHQFVARTVREELLVGVRQKKLFRAATYTPEDEAKAEEILHRLRLEHLAKANPFTLSGGQKRRLSVATALINAPRLLFFDEPTFGQDRTTFIELVSLMRELTNTGTTVISISHDELFIAAMADQEIRL